MNQGQEQDQVLKQAEEVVIQTSAHHASSPVSSSPLLEHISNFASHLRDDDLSSSTISYYTHDVNAFLKWLAKDLGGDMLPTYQDAARYRDWLLRNKKAVATANRAVASVKRFLGWAVAVGVLNTSGKVKPIRTITHPRPALSRRDGLRYLHTLDQNGTPKERMLVMACLGCGLRVSEVLSLTVGDVVVDPRQIVLKVVGKAKIAREVRVKGDRTRKAVLDRLHELEDQEAQKRTGQPWDGQLPKRTEFVDVGAAQARNIVAKFGRLAGVEGVHPHMLRRTYAQARRASGIPIETVARELGHMRLETTLVYTTPEGEDWDVLPLEEL